LSVDVLVAGGTGISYRHAIGHAAALVVKERNESRRITGATIRDTLAADGAQLS